MGDATPDLRMMNLVVGDMASSVEFYRRLGVTVPDGEAREVAVGLVAAADQDRRRRVAEAGDLLGRQREAQEVDRGGLAVLPRAFDVGSPRRRPTPT
jgi:hypothetical protein